MLCKPGALTESGSRRNVDRSFVVLFEVMDESQSWYLEDSIRMFGNSASKDVEDFGESNLMHCEL